MKAFLWFLFAQFTVACGICGVMSILIGLISDQFVYLPYFSNIIISHGAWIFLCPSPWLIYTIFLCHRHLGKKTLMLYSILIMIATLILASVVVLACILPSFYFARNAAQKDSFP